MKMNKVIVPLMLIVSGVTSLSAQGTGKSFRLEGGKEQGNTVSIITKEKCDISVIIDSDPMMGGDWVFVYKRRISSSRIWEKNDAIFTDAHISRQHYRYQTLLQ